MPRGLKETSSLITISARVVESAANTFTSQKVDLQLNPLDNEVFLVYSIDLDLQQSDNIDATITVVEGALSTTERTAAQGVGGLSDSNVLAASRMVINNQTTNAVMTEFSSDSAPSTMLPYIGIIATNDFYLNVEGTNQSTTKFLNAKVYGVRARADSSVYAALVQSEAPS